MAVPTGQAPRVYNTFEAGLELRDAAAAAITTVGGSFAAPDYESAVFDIGEGQCMKRTILQNLAITLDGANDSKATIMMIGLDEAEAVEEVLGAITIGDETLGPNTAEPVDGDEFNFLWSNVQKGVIFPKVKLIVVTQGTSISIDFTAFMTPLN